MTRRTRRPDRRRLKALRSYTIEEVARTLEIHRNTVRHWIKAGLPVIDNKRPILMLGSDLAEFLLRRRDARRQPCQAGEMFCLKCRKPREPAGRMAEVSAADITRTMQIGLDGASSGLLHSPESREDVPIRVQLGRADRSSIDSLTSLRLPSASGGQVSISELTNVEKTTIDTSLYGKNLRPVVYVLGDVAGEEESPVYAIQKMSRAIDQLKVAEGYYIKQYNVAMPTETDRLSMKWDGEWHITVEVFRDLGLAFAAVLVLIYVLVVGWFRSFIVPLVIMAPIPLTLVGILPAHALMGAFFTATSMIGFIAGAGIIVRNSIILVDFIELRREQGMDLEAAVVDAGAVRFRPMLLTAAAVVVGASVILFDPIFQGLAISLMAGEVASTLLSRMAVPVLYYMVEKRNSPAPPTLKRVPEPSEVLL